MVDAARSGWTKVRAILKGKTIMKDGESLVIEERQVGTGKCARKDEEFQGEWEESEIGGTVEVLEKSAGVYISVQKRYLFPPPF
jgi:hypothetical protein